MVFPNFWSVNQPWAKSCVHNSLYKNAPDSSKQLFILSEVLPHLFVLQTLPEYGFVGAEHELRIHKKKWRENSRLCGISSFHSLKALKWT